MNIQMSFMLNSFVCELLSINRQKASFHLLLYTIGDLTDHYSSQVNSIQKQTQSR